MASGGENGEGSTINRGTKEGVTLADKAGERG
jgi:hypothetical protein